MESQEDGLAQVVYAYLNAMIYGQVDLAAHAVEHARKKYGVNRDQLNAIVVKNHVLKLRTSLGLKTELPHEFECDCLICISAAHERRAQIQN